MALGDLGVVQSAGIGSLVGVLVDDGDDTRLRNVIQARLCRHVECTGLRRRLAHNGVALLLVPQAAVGVFRYELTSGASDLAVLPLFQTVVESLPCVIDFKGQLFGFLAVAAVGRV